MPRMTTERPKDSKKSLRFFLASLKSFRLTIIISLIFAAAAGVLNLFGPKILGNMTNSAVASITETGALDLETIKTAAAQLKKLGWKQAKKRGTSVYYLNEEYLCRAICLDKSGSMVASVRYYVP